MLIFFNYMDFKYILIFCGFSLVKALQQETTRNTTVVKYVCYSLLTTVKENPQHGNHGYARKRVI